MPLSLEDFEELSRISATGDSDAGAKSSSWIKYFIWKALNYDWFTVKEKETLLTELTQIQNLKQNYVLPCLDFIDHAPTSTIFVITEYCENGNLQELMNKCRSDGTYLHGNFIWKILYQILRALETVNFSKKSELALYHQLLSKHIYLDSKWNVKLGVVDMVLERYFCFQKSEQINRKPCTVKSEVWSVGCIIYELCALMPPFTAVNWTQMMSKFNHDILQRIPWIYSDEMQNIISEMLTYKEDERPSIAKLLSKSIFAPFLSKMKKHDFAGSMWDIIYQHKLKGINQKEKVLVLHERKLNERQTEIEESERQLSLKMRNLQEQLDRAEKIVGQFTINRTFASAPELNTVESCPPPLPVKVKKKVHFKFQQPEKENTSRSEFEKHRQELEKRLQKAQIRALSIRNDEIQSRHADRILTLPR
uniref:non-specific serine/threonine protein kinase n=1 Tax=Strigamia maritima TaxID=126957 RepID=T1J0L1_STRMM